jgi:anion-transporting  ArsA/GET3 family ATPase
MNVDELFGPRIVVISGKGGVGKTTVAAALAVIAARTGRKVCVAEVDEKGSLPRLFGHGELSYEPAEISPGIWGLNITAEKALREYLRLQYHMRRLSQVFTGTHFVDYLATSAPGFNDMLVIRKIWYLEQGPEKGGADQVYDTIIVDAPAAGHMLTFVGAPQGFYDAIPVGPIRHQVQWVLDMIEDPARTRVSLVTTAEEMPVSETVETIEALHGRIGVGTGPMFVNSLYDGLFSKEDLNALEIVDPDRLIALAAAVGLALDKEDVSATESYARFLEARRAIQHRHLRALRRGVKEPIVELPFLFSAGLGAPDIVTLADVIEARLAAL